MSSMKKFNLGGVDLKSNDLVRDPMRASDSRNCTKTIKGDIDKRSGYALNETFSSLQESCYYKTLDQDILVKTDGTIWKPYNSARQSCSIALLNPGGNVIYTEYLSSLYLTTDDGKTPIVKFDGSDAYLAGVPASNFLYPTSPTRTTATISSPGTPGYYYRFFYSFKDLNGNITFGPYVQMTSTVNNATITVSSFKTGNSYGAFYNKYMTNKVLTAQTITQANNFLFANATNYIAGDILMIDIDECGLISNLTGAKRRFINLTITAVQTIGAGNIKITFDATQLVGISFDIASTAAATPIDCRLKLRSFISTAASFGYLECSPVTFTSGSDINSIVFQVGQAIDNSADNQASASITSSPFFDYSMGKFEDIYNEDGQKIRPPLAKFITAYGDQLVYGNLIGAWDQINNFVQYNNDDLIMYSDIGFSDNGENNSANTQKIGESYDGSITGISRCNDLLVVTKDNSIYSLDGILDPGGYSLRKIPTNYIGCLSHRSIIKTEGGVFFNGNDGIFFTDGVNCSKMSQIIDPFFVNIDSTKSRSTIDSKNRKYLFYMTDGSVNYCLAFSYEFKEWFIWDVLNMSKGIYQKNDKTVFFSNSSSVYKFTGLYSDNGSAISAYYKTNWEDVRTPALDKKFKYNRIWNLNSVSSSFNMATQKNWIDTDLGVFACSIVPYGTIQKAHDQLNVQSIRYVFSNSVLNQGMLITGYEIEFEGTQSIDKGN